MITAALTGIGRRDLRKWRRALFAISLLGATAAFGDAIDVAKASGVKAAWLRHIAALTTWPGDDDDVGLPIGLGVMGPDPNGVVELIRARIETADGLMAQGRPLQLVELHHLRDNGESLSETLKRCDLLFLSENGESDWERIRPLIDSLPIVTVSEIESFARRGGMIEYVIDVRAGRVRMIVNMEAVRRAGVQLSARLLALTSVIVIDQDEEEAE